jgi:hypothetical protein
MTRNRRNLWRREARKRLVHIAGCCTLYRCWTVDELMFWLDSAEMYGARIPRSFRRFGLI